MPLSSSEAIDAEAWEIAQPWPWKRRSSMRSSLTRMCTPSSSPHSGLCSSASRSCGLELAEVPRALVVVEDVVAVEVVHQAVTARRPRARPSSAVDERVDVGGLVVDADARARGRADAEAAHQRLRAVVAGADADAVAVDQLGDVVRVDALDREGGEPAAPLGLGRADDAQAGHLARGARACSAVSARSCARTRSMPSPRGSRRPRPARRPRRSSGCPPRTSHGSSFQVADWKSTEAIMSPPVRNGCIGSSISRAAVQHADAGRPERLVAGPGVEVGADRRRRRRASAGPPARRRSSETAPAARTRATISATGLIVPSTFETWVKATSRTSPRASSASSCLERELAALVDLQVAQLGAALAAEHLPGHEVRVVLHLGDQHRVAGADVRAAPRVGDEVDRLGHVLGEDRRLAARAPANAATRLRAPS